MNRTLTDDVLAAAREALDDAVIVPHTDADGLASGAIALRAAGRDAREAVLLPRGRTPWGEDLPDGYPALLDWGVRALDRPALIVDHHAPEADARDDQIVVSGYGERPEVSTSVLMRRIAPGQPAWLAAVGAAGDLGGAGLALPELGGVPRTAVRKLTALVNAPRRVPGGPIDQALALLVESPSPDAALGDRRARVLEECKDEWQEAFGRAMRVAPVVGNGAAMIRFSSPYQVHPLVATAWQRRLAPRLVLAANEDYLPGRVNFSVRGGEGDLRRVLREALPDVNGEYAHGHDRATGGSLEPHDFDRLLAVLGLAR